MTDIRWHSSDAMDNLPEFSDYVHDPVAVVIRPDGSIDTYGAVTFVDQRPATPATPPPLHVRIVQSTPDEGVQLIADLPAWPYPLPQVDDYLFHPPYGDLSPEGIAGHVKTVTWRMHDRSADPDAKAFVQTTHPYVEIVI